MMHEIGTIKSIFRYPVKSMAGEELASAELGWHGIEGDRRYAFMRTGKVDDYPWLTASRMPGLLRYKAYYRENPDGVRQVLRVLTPSGEDLGLESGSLVQQVSSVFGNTLRMIKLDNGIFDDSPISIISTETISALEEASGREIDARRFRPNLIIEPIDGTALGEESWVGQTITIGDRPDAPSVRVNLHDIRCVMVNLDPDTAASDPGVLRTIARTRNNCAGVYGSPLRCGIVKVGDSVYV